MGSSIKITEDNRSGQFELSTDDESGVALINQTGSEINNLSIQAEGEWSNELNSNVEAEGNVAWIGDRQKLKYPLLAPLSLVGVNNSDDNDVFLIGKSRSVILRANGKFTLVINAPSGTYPQNKGHLTISWQAS
ncbi:MAG: hypothetical protein KME30_31910 [Iphinoe sp. HA4291-MV1]|jgi:hypothetical protein|nr:hypothetical protein [Iphinoe sp. HA4291-MV1]